MKLKAIFRDHKWLFLKGDTLLGSLEEPGHFSSGFEIFPQACKWATHYLQRET